jgi:hypothetical protein
MKHRWRKIGRLYSADAHERHPKLLTHASNPLPLHLHDDVFRVFYSGRDNLNRSSVGAVDIDIVKAIVVNDHPEPFFVHGSEDSFFSHGVSIGNTYCIGDQRYMLFMGWQVPLNGHWKGDIGRLKVDDSLHLSLDSELPFMAVDTTDTLSLSYPWVIQHSDLTYTMWYGSTVTWNAGNGEMLHTINQAVSKDGHVWKRLGVALPFKLGYAQAFSRPTVLKSKDGGYDMWFSFRSGNGTAYRIGYATSIDGYSWNLYDGYRGIDVSDSGWDSEMIEYPFVFDHQGQRYMLYNGNGYGRSGFGLAILEC